MFPVDHPSHIGRVILSRTARGPTSDGFEPRSSRIGNQGSFEHMIYVFLRTAGIERGFGCIEGSI